MRIDENVLVLIKKGVSLNIIHKITGHPKSTIYYHYKKIKGKKINKISLNFKNENELGELLGVFAGDGSFYIGKNFHYTIRIYIGAYEKGYVSYLYKKLIKWFNKKPHTYLTFYRNKISCVVFHYDSKVIYSLLNHYLNWQGKKTYTIHLKNFDLKNKKFNLGFLRGLIDTDGNYYAPKRRISFSTTSKKLGEQTHKIIKYNAKLNPHTSVYRKKGRVELYTLYLHGEKAKKLIKLINPNNPSKLR